VDYDASLADPAFQEESVRLPDGNMIVMGQQKFSAPEIIFQPGLASKKTCGLGELVYYSLMKCDEKVRGELANNITLSGGNTKFPNFDKRSQLSIFIILIFNSSQTLTRSLR
jgi:actin beta/gamma 1